MTESEEVLQRRREKILSRAASATTEDDEEPISPISKTNVFDRYKLLKEREENEVIMHLARKGWYSSARYQDCSYSCSAAYWDHRSPSASMPFCLSSRPTLSQVYIQRFSQHSREWEIVRLDHQESPAPGQASPLRPIRFDGKDYLKLIVQFHPSHRPHQCRPENLQWPLWSCCVCNSNGALIDNEVWYKLNCNQEPQAMHSSSMGAPFLRMGHTLGASCSYDWTFDLNFLLISVSASSRLLSLRSFITFTSSSSSMISPASFSSASTSTVNLMGSAAGLLRR